MIRAGIALVGLAGVAAAVLCWRQGQFEGHGLEATLRGSPDCKGPVLARRVDTAFDFGKSDPFLARDRMCAEWTGTLVLPEDAFYLLATDSFGASSIEIDGKLVLQNPGTEEKHEAEARQALEAGARAVRLRYSRAAPHDRPRLRVYWAPFDRRGGREYVPATLLFPQPPGRVDPRRARSIPPRDLPALLLLGGALGLALVVVGWGPLRRWAALVRGDPTRKRDLLLALALVGAALALRLWDLSAAGQTWDEDVYWAAGRSFVQNLLSLDFHTHYWTSNLEHPALAKWLYGPATLVADDLGPARVVAAVLGAVTCGVVFLAGRDLVGRAAALVGGALCAVMPHVVAHAKVVGLETPSGLFYALGVWTFHRALAGAGSSSLFLGAGLCAGLACSTRLSNASLLLVALLIYLGAHGRQVWRTRRLELPLGLALYPFVAAATFVALWPYLWGNPLQHLGEMLVEWLPDSTLENFLGRPRSAPLYYFPLYLAVTLPAGALAALVVGIGVAAARCRRAAAPSDGEEIAAPRPHLTLLLWLAGPFCAAATPMVRDGVRYLYPALMPACLLMGVGLVWIGGWLARRARRPRAERPVVAALGTLAAAYVLAAGLSVHPFYLDYYNELVGGPESVERRRLFEISWWGEGLEEAARVVNHSARAGDTVAVEAEPFHVMHLRPDLVRAPATRARFVICNKLTNESRFRPDRHRAIHVVRAGDAPLVWVYERKDLATHAPPRP